MPFADEHAVDLPGGIAPEGAPALLLEIHHRLDDLLWAVGALGLVGFVTRVLDISPVADPASIQGGKLIEVFGELFNGHPRALSSCPTRSPRGDPVSPLGVQVHGEPISSWRGRHHVRRGHVSPTT